MGVINTLVVCKIHVYLIIIIYDQGHFRILLLFF